MNLLGQIKKASFTMEFCLVWCPLSQPLHLFQADILSNGEIDHTKLNLLLVFTVLMKEQH